MRARALAVAAMLAFGVGPAIAAATVYVDDSGTDSATCGTTTVTPCKTIHFALALTNVGDTVIVGSGTYNECVEIKPGTGVGRVIVLADALDSSNQIGQSILDGAGVCDAASGFPGPVVVVYDQSVFSGFAVKNGGDSGVWGLGGVTITNNLISDNTTATTGGGLRVTTGTYLTAPVPPATEVSPALIKFNTIQNNTSGSSGAGLYVDASADGLPSVVDIDGNTVKTNTAGSVSGASGGGMTVLTGTASADDISTVTMTTNVLDGNMATIPAAGGADAYGGGLYVATGGGTGLGTEAIVIGGLGTGNMIRNNVSEGIGGGLSVNLRPVDGASHSIVVLDNSVTANTGDLGGGGVHASALAEDCLTGTNSLTLTANSIIGNHALGDITDPSTVGGGGIYAEYASSRTPAGVVSFQIVRNGIRANDATTFGGGASLKVLADDDPDLDGNTLPTSASLQFENNLVAVNSAINTEVGGTPAVGGGVSLLAEAIGAQASTVVTQRFLTVVGNQSDAGAGGLEWSATSDPDTVSGPGTVALSLSNSILQGNDGFAVGGPILPGGTISVSINYNDAFENVDGDYEAQLGASTGTNGNISVDPALDFLYAPPLCSPTVDQGDPLIDPNDEPPPNGKRVNLGHLGDTIDATRTFPDVNGDGAVDGVDVLGIAVSFNSSLILGDPRYFIAADRDLNGLVDGVDLAYVSAFYAQSCPATGAGRVP
jgi:hypothetical protein